MALSGWVLVFGIRIPPGLSLKKVVPIRPIWRRAFLRSVSPFPGCRIAWNSLKYALASERGVRGSSWSYHHATTDGVNRASNAGGEVAFDIDGLDRAVHAEMGWNPTSLTMAVWWV